MTRPTGMRDPARNSPGLTGEPANTGERMTTLRLSTKFSSTTVTGPVSKNLVLPYEYGKVDDTAKPPPYQIS